MKVSKIRDDVWKFKGVGSVFLIKGDQNVLIDAGDSADREDLKSEIAKVVPLNKIDIILLTHLHYDHLGGLDLFPNAKVFASGIELQDYVENARGFEFYVNDKVDKILREKAKPLPEAKGATGDRRQVTGGDMFGLKVLKVPGHTRGSVAFLDEKRKLLFSGDSIFGGGMIGRTDFPNSLPDEMEWSVKKLRKLVMDEGLGLCPGHGYWEDQQNI